MAHGRDRGRGRRHARARPPASAIPRRPCRSAVGVRPLALAGRTVTADVTLRAHEFGAVTVLFAAPFDDVACEELPALTAWLTADTTLETVARAVLDEALPRLASAIVRPAPDGQGLVEDYYVVQVSRFAPDADAPGPPRHASRPPRPHRALRAAGARARAETDEVLRTAVTYQPRDLVVDGLERGAGLRRGMGGRPRRASSS